MHALRPRKMDGGEFEIRVSLGDLFDQYNRFSADRDAICVLFAGNDPVMALAIRRNGNLRRIYDLFHVQLGGSPVDSAKKVRPDGRLPDRFLAAGLNSGMVGPLLVRVIDIR